MSNIAKGRVEFLQTEVVEAILRASEIDTLSTGGVKNIFGKLLSDPTINLKLRKRINKGQMVECKVKPPPGSKNTLFDKEGNFLYS